jgi:hypothetical protein
MEESSQTWWMVNGTADRMLSWLKISALIN